MRTGHRGRTGPAGVSLTGTPECFQPTHEALLYTSAEQFQDTLVGFLRDGLSRDQGCVVATTAPRIAALREALGRDAGAVTFLDQHDQYRQPARALAGWRSELEAAAGRGKPYVRIVGEVGFGAGARQLSWTRYESVVNAVFADAPAWLLCPYDVRNLPPEVVAGARRTHPVVRAPEPRPSPAYQPPEQLLRQVPEPLPAVSGEPVLVTGIDTDLAGLRVRVGRMVLDGGWLPAGRLGDLHLALTEVAANGLRHGSPPLVLRVWRLPTGVACEVTDHGPGPNDPLLPYRPPTQEPDSGRGLWIASQVCEELAIDTAGGVTRVRFALHDG